MLNKQQRLVRMITYTVVLLPMLMVVMNGTMTCCYDGVASVFLVLGVYTSVAYAMSVVAVWTQYRKDRMQEYVHRRPYLVPMYIGAMVLVFVLCAETLRLFAR